MDIYKNIARLFTGTLAALDRAFRYGGVRELLGSVWDGLTAIADTAIHRLRKREDQGVVWPTFSPELLAYRPYRLAVCNDISGDATHFSDFLGATRSGVSRYSTARKTDKTDANITVFSGAAEPHHQSGGASATHDLAGLQSALQRAYDAPDMRVLGAETDAKWIIDFSACAQPLVSIIIPTRDQVVLLKACVDSIREHTKMTPYEIIIVDNGSTEYATHAYLKDLVSSDPSRVSVIKDPAGFNWSRLNNLAAREARGSSIVFLNNDIEVRSSDWLVQLSGFAGAHGVGCVGAMLLFDDGSIQHAGVVVGIGRWADHLYKGSSPDLPAGGTPFVPPSVTRPVMAVTGACLAISKAHFVALNGFDEAFSVIFSDVDLCVRAHRAGLRNIYCAEVRLIHHESKTRDPKRLPDGDFRRARQALAPYRVDEVDPYFNPALDKLSVFPRRRGQAVDLSRWIRM